MNLAHVRRSDYELHRNEMNNRKKGTSKVPTEEIMFDEHVANAFLQRRPSTSVLLLSVERKGQRGGQRSIAGVRRCGRESSLFGLKSLQFGHLFHFEFHIQIEAELTQQSQFVGDLKAKEVE